MRSDEYGCDPCLKIYTSDMEVYIVSLKYTKLQKAIMNYLMRIENKQQSQPKTKTNAIARQYRHRFLQQSAQYFVRPQRCLFTSIVFAIRSNS